MFVGNYYEVILHTWRFREGQKTTPEIQTGNYPEPHHYHPVKTNYIITQDRQLPGTTPLPSCKNKVHPNKRLKKQRRNSKDNNKIVKFIRKLRVIII